MKTRRKSDNMLKAIAKTIRLSALLAQKRSMDLYNPDRLNRNKGLRKTTIKILYFQHFGIHPVTTYDYMIGSILLKKKQKEPIR